MTITPAQPRVTNIVDGVRELAALLQANMEPTEPVDTILAYFKERAGKLLTSRDITKLNERIPGYDIWRRHIAGMTQLVWGNYDNRASIVPGGSLLLDWKTTGIIIDPDTLVERNGAYFSARDMRNANRQRALTDTSAKILQRVATLITIGNDALATLQAVKKELDTFVGFGQLFNADQYRIQRMAGVDGLDDYVKKQNADLAGGK
jgi:hypothetical protein